MQKLPILSRSLQWSSFFFRKWQLYVATIGGSSLTFTLAPLFFEYTAELAYPVDEGLLGGFLTCFNNVTGGIFLCLFFIPNIGTTWMNYALLGSSIGMQFIFVSHTPTLLCHLLIFPISVSIPAVLLTKESYRRLDVDLPQSVSSVSNVAHPYETLPDQMVT